MTEVKSRRAKTIETGNQIAWGFPTPKIIALLTSPRDEMIYRGLPWLFHCLMEPPVPSLSLPRVSSRAAIFATSSPFGLGPSCTKPLLSRFFVCCRILACSTIPSHASKINRDKRQKPCVRTTRAGAEATHYPVSFPYAIKMFDISPQYANFQPPSSLMRPSHHVVVGFSPRGTCHLSNF